MLNELPSTHCRGFGREIPPFAELQTILRLNYLGQGARVVAKVLGPLYLLVFRFLPRVSLSPQWQGCFKYGLTGKTKIHVGVIPSSIFRLQNLRLSMQAQIVRPV